MKMNLNDIPAPLNATERLLYAIVVRQNIQIEQMNSLIEHIAKRDGIATTNNKSVEPQATVEEEKPAPKKRTTTRKKKEE